MNCKNFEERIALYIEGDLPEFEGKEVKIHLDSCKACQEFASELKQSIHALKELREEPIPDALGLRVHHVVLKKLKRPEENLIYKHLPWLPLWMFTPLSRYAISFAMMLLFFIVLGRYSGWQQNPFIPSGSGEVQIEENTITQEKSRKGYFIVQLTPEERKGSNKTKKTGEIVAIEPSSIQQEKTKPSIETGGKHYVSKTTQDSGEHLVLRGKVVDTRGAPLPRVTLTFFDNQQKILAKLMTDFEGKFSWTPEPGQVPFLMKAEHDGFATRLIYLNQGAGNEVLLALHLTGQESKSVGQEVLPRSSSDEGVLTRNVPTDRAKETMAQKSMPKLEESQHPAPEPPPTQIMAMRAPQSVPAEPAISEEAAIQADRLLILREEDKRDFKRKRQSLEGIPGRGTEPLTGELRAMDDQGKEVGTFPLKHTGVQAEISGYLARTQVEQVYTNPYKEVIEAVYVYPLPTMAAVHDFVMKIGDRTIVGIVRPREEAERIYQEARARGQTASLLTQERPNIFTQQVANIEPGGEVRIEITYFERLKYEDGWYEYVFPMVIGPRYIPGKTQPSSVGTRESGGGIYPPTDRVPDADRISPPVVLPGNRSGHDIDITVELNAGLPIRELRIPTHQVDIENHGKSQRVIRLKEMDRIPNRDFVMRWRVDGDVLEFGVLAHRGKEGGFFTLMMQPPLNPSDEQVTPREITFIMDVSGSMSGVPIETSKKVVEKTLNRMRSFDMFNIVVFSGWNGQLWEKPRLATPDNIAEALHYIQTLRGSGGTEMLAGLQRALRAQHDRRYLQMYIFLTDGYIGNEAEILRTIKNERGEARFFGFGIGSSVNRYLIDGIGELGCGQSMVVLPRDRNSLEQAVQMFFKAIDSPVLVDIQFTWDGVNVMDLFPEKLPDLFAGQTIAVIGRYQSKGSGRFLIRGRVGGKHVEYEIPVRLPASEPENSALAPVWARAKIHQLVTQWITENDDNKKKDLVGRITDLGVRYKLVTQFTAFVAVDESRIVGDGRPIRVMQPVELPQDVDYRGIFGENPVGIPMELPVWGAILIMDQSGHVRVARIEPHSPLAGRGISVGAILERIGRTQVMDLGHLESLLLQVGGAAVDVTFNPGGTVSLPRP